jgi:hypothetical protein
MKTNWTIHQLERSATDNFVLNVHWRYSMTDTDESGKQYYADTYSVASYTQDPEKDDYIPYEELTEEMVISWIKSSLDTEAIDKNLADQIESQKNPPILTGLPWEKTYTNNVEEVVEEEEE